MKNVKLFLIFSIIALSLNAQSVEKRVYVRDSQSMILILNDEIIGSTNLLKSIPSEQLQEITVHKDKKLSSRENLFFDNDESGIMLANTEFNIEIRDQSTLNEFFGLDPETDLYVNGCLLENKNYKIALNIIEKIEIIEREKEFLKEPVLNISIK